MHTLALAVALSACSWAMMDRPPEKRRKGQDVTCTEGPGWAIADGAIVALEALSVYVLLDIRDVSGPVVDGALVASVIGGILHLSSGITGAKWVADCRGMRADYYAEESGGDDAGVPDAGE